MEFHLIKKEAITDEDIIEEMKSVMKKLGKTKLTMKEFDANASSGGLHNIHFDHVIPWSKGGETTLENLQVLCLACNEAKGNM